MENDPRCTPMKFNCPFCDEEFVNKNNFDDHMNIHNENSYEEYIPSENEDIEENANFLTRKRKRFEKPAKKTKKKSKTEFRCGKCESTFSRKDSLNRHVKNYCKK